MKSKQLRARHFIIPILLIIGLGVGVYFQYHLRGEGIVAQDKENPLKALQEVVEYDTSGILRYKLGKNTTTVTLNVQKYENGEWINLSQTLIPLATEKGLIAVGYDISAGGIIKTVNSGDKIDVNTKIEPTGCKLPQVTWREIQVGEKVDIKKGKPICFAVYLAKSGNHIKGIKKGLLSNDLYSDDDKLVDAEEAYALTLTFA